MLAQPRKGPGIGPGQGPGGPLGIAHGIHAPGKKRSLWVRASEILRPLRRAQAQGHAPPRPLPQRKRRIEGQAHPPHSAQLGRSGAPGEHLRVGALGWPALHRGDGEKGLPFLVSRRTEAPLQAMVEGVGREQRTRGEREEARRKPGPCKGREKGHGKGRRHKGRTENQGEGEAPKGCEGEPSEPIALPLSFP